MYHSAQMALIGPFGFCSVVDIAGCTSILRELEGVDNASRGSLYCRHAQLLHGMNKPKLLLKLPSCLCCLTKSLESRSDDPIWLMQIIQSINQSIDSLDPLDQCKGHPARSDQWGSALGLWVCSACLVPTCCSATTRKVSRGLTLH